MVQDDDTWGANKIKLGKRRCLNDVETFKYLISLGVDINLAFRSSAEYGYLKVVQYLLENGADLRSEDDYALRLSAENGHLEIVEFLLEKVPIYMHSIIKL